LLWYPLLPGNAHRPMVEGIIRQAEVEVLVSELRVPVSGEGMHGSGMLVINPTWGLVDQLDGLAGWFAPLGQGNVILRNRLNTPS
jgi:23S rRNA (adenine2030-N6)-methyltransferase